MMLSRVLRPRKTAMSQTLMNVLTLGHCSHQFSWPRRSSDGHYYQVCLLCATEYKYDWKAMRRTERVDRAATAQSAATRRNPSHARKATWVPRARRLKLNTPVRYRAKHQTIWCEGVIENLSQSGVLIRGAQSLPQNALVEMIFEMPEEISGQKNSSVLCQGRVNRAQEKRPGEKTIPIAASVLDYKFLRSN